MTDEEYFEEGVNLADGWSIEVLDQTIGIVVNDATLDELWTHDKWLQTTIDALAAQLVRQVDALEDNEYHVDVGREEVWVGTCDSYDGIQTIKKVTASDSDRTMNTIKAIVDSGVLKK